MARTHPQTALLGVVVAIALAVAALGASPASAEVSFQATALEPAGKFVEDVAVGDLDGRNGPDIVTAYGEGGVGVQLNDGHGHFGPAQLYPTGCDTTQVEIADVGAPPSSIFPDGHPDVVIACSYGGGETIYLGRMFGDGAGGLSAPDMFPGSNYGSFNGLALSHQAFALVEFRGLSGPPVPVGSTLYQEGGFKFHRLFCLSYDWSKVECSTPGAGSEPYVPFVPGIVAEAELYTTGGTQGLLGWGPNPSWHASERDFGPVPKSLDPADGIWRSITIGDLESNGPDILTSAGTCGCIPEEPATGRVSVLYGDIAGGVPIQTATTFPSASGVQSIATGDFDLDGKTDVVGDSWRYENGVGGVGGVFVQSGDGAGHLGPPQEITLYHGETHTVIPVRVADLDGNGTPDVVTAVGGKVQVLLNQKQPSPPTGSPGAGGVGQGGTSGSGGSTGKVAANPFAGIKGLPTSARALPDGTVPLGTATNPPASKILLTAIVSGGSATGSSIAARPAKGKHGKPAKVVGKAQLTVPSGKTVPLQLKLDGAGKSLLKTNPLRTTLTIVATAAGGDRQTKTQALTIKPAKKKKHR